MAFKLVFLLTIISSLFSDLHCQAQVLSERKPDLVVAADGSGDFTTVAAAAEAAPSFRDEQFIIYIKSGIYKENVKIEKNKTNIVFVGDGSDATLVTSDRSVHDGVKTSDTATIVILGKGFVGKLMTFENTAGPINEQAVAVLSESAYSGFYKCTFKGYQDTLYAKDHIQFYRECDIYGTVDFVFGDAQAVFQNCNLFVRKPLPQQKNTITAQGRQYSNYVSGFVFHNCSIVAASDLAPNKSSFQTFLGRPWREFSRTIVMQSFLDDIVDPKGWLEWNASVPVDKLFYAEFNNRGPGADTKGRVRWPGFRVLHSFQEAANFTVRNFIAGDTWIPSTGIPFVPDFL